MRWTILAALALSSLAGCADLLKGEGDESLVVRNTDSRPVNVILIIEQEEGGLRVFAQDIFLESGEARDYNVTMRPGEHVAQVAVSNGASEILRLTIPERGDTAIEFSVHRRGASLSVTH